MANKKVVMNNKKLIVIILVIIIVGYLVINYLNSNMSLGMPPQSCVSASPFYCQDKVLSTNGNISFTLGLDNNQIDYNVHLACIFNGSAINVPFGQSFNNNALGKNSVLQYGSNLDILNLPCYYTNGTKVNGLQRGKVFFFSIWINYTNSNQTPSVANPTINTPIIQTYASAT